MANPETIEFLSFRRTFTLLILLVVLPSAGLSGFGIVAIVNERAAVEKRLELVWHDRLDVLSADFRKALGSAEVSLDSGLGLRATGVSLTHNTFRVEQNEVQSSDPTLRAVITSLGADFGALPQSPVFFSVAAPQGTVLLAAMRQGNRVFGAQLSISALEQLLLTLGGNVVPPSESARFMLVPVKHEAVDGVMARLVSGVTEVREAALGSRELAGATLPAPLQDFRLVAYAEGEDPVALTSRRNRILYSVLLAVFCITLVLGVVFTGRTLYREARLSRLKTDFVSLVSHELRTPLTSIRLFIDMLALGRVKDPTEMQTVLDLLAKETARLSSMIEKVLDWSRIESGERAYHREIQPVTRVVDVAVAAFRASRMGATMTFTVEIADDLPNIDADRDAISSALLNLLQNAFKYTDHDKHIALRVGRDGTDVVVEVQDNGVGIARREQKRIFERFYRIDSLLTRETEGSGLGLSIAQRIVRAHQGRISIDSTPGKGSTFRLHLPGVNA